MDIILVPGLWLDASSWDPIAPVLESAGHTVHALTMPGVGAPASESAVAEHLATAEAAGLVGVEPEGVVIWDVVAEQLAEWPALGLPDLAGPEVLAMHRLARRVSRARGLGRRVVAVPVPGAAGRGMRDGSLTLRGGGVTGTTTFDQWLRA